jgi:hypothetical protein
MDKRSDTLSKTCSSCGQQKPLTAFLQLSEANSTHYGNICASCRKTALENAEVIEAEDSSKSKTRLAIDAKTKVQIEQDKRKERQHLKELQLQEDKKETEEKSVTLEKQAQTSKTERKHREGKRSFLDFPTQRVGPSQEVFGGKEQIAKEGKIDLSVSQTDLAISGKVKYQSAIWHEFLTRIGVSAPRAAATQKLSNHHAPADKASLAMQEKRAALVENLKKWADTQHTKEPTENPAEEFVHKNWGPKRP